MALEPAEALDNYVRENSDFVTRDGWRIPVYRGRQNVAELKREDLRSLFTILQDSFNEGLAQRKQVPEHIDDLPFYLDYIDSDFSNAVAFRDDSYAFIGLTVALMYELQEICARLGESEAIRRILGVEDAEEVREGLSVVLFQHLLSLVVTHEFTHHVHGHVLKHRPDAKFFSEFAAGNGSSNIERQAEEADADGYAAGDGAGSGRHRSVLFRTVKRRPRNQQHRFGPRGRTRTAAAAALQHGRLRSDRGCLAGQQLQHAAHTIDRLRARLHYQAGRDG